MQSLSDDKQALVGRVLESKCVLIEAPAGCGKSHLVKAIAATVPAVSWLRHHSELVEEVAGRSAGVGPVLLLDDAPSIDDKAGDTGGLSDALEAALRVDPGVRIVVAGRNLGPSVRAIASRPGYLLVEAEDLLLSEGEIRRLLAARGLSAAVGEAATAQIHHPSDGWPTLAMGMVELVSSSGLEALKSAAGGSAWVRPLMASVTEPLSPSDRSMTVQLALLPWIDDTMIAALGVDDLVERQLRLGLPLIRRRDGTLRLPPAVRMYLGTDQELDSDVVRRVAPALTDRGQAMEATRLLLQSGGPPAASEFLARLPAQVVEGLDPDELASMLELLDGETVRWPDLLLLRATVEAGRVGLETQRMLLERAAAATTGVDVERVRGEAQAELIFTRALAGTYSNELRAEVEAEIVAGGQEAPGRREIRLIEALGVLVASDDSSEALEEASLLLDRAAMLWQHVGERKRACASLRLLSIQALIPLGRYVEAEAAMAKADELSQGNTIEQARNIVVTARIAVLAGRHETEKHMVVADELGRVLRQPWIGGYADWSRMLAAGLERNVDAQRSLQDRAWSQFGELRNHTTGLVFLCEAITGMARSGQIEDAKRMLEQVRPRRSENELEFALAEVAVLGRHAPVEEVQARVEELLTGGQVPLARRWTLLLHLAVAFDRAASPETATVLERVALESELCGLPELPARLEPELFRRSSVRADSSVEGDPHVDQLSIQLLGQFAIRRDSSEVQLSSARVAKLVKILAVRTGSAPIDLIIDTLWPEVDPTIGRRRLKNVLSRARSDLGDVLVREPDRVTFSSSVVVDLFDFDLAARQAFLLAQTDPQGATSAGFRALALYQGELLPDDRYEDWAESARSDLRARSLALVDLILADPTVLTSQEGIAAATEILLRIDPNDPDRLQELAVRCTDAGNLASASALRRQIERASPWTDQPN